MNRNQISCCWSLWEILLESLFSPPEDDDDAKCVRASLHIIQCLVCALNFIIAQPLERSKSLLIKSITLALSLSPSVAVYKFWPKTKLLIVSESP